MTITIAQKKIEVSHKESEIILVPSFNYLGCPQLGGNTERENRGAGQEYRGREHLEKCQGLFNGWNIKYQSSKCHNQKLLYLGK